MIEITFKVVSTDKEGVVDWITGQDEVVHRTEGRTASIRASGTRAKASIQPGVLSPALSILSTCICSSLHVSVILSYFSIWTWLLIVLA